MTNYTTPKWEDKSFDEKHIIEVKIQPQKIGKVANFNRFLGFLSAFSPFNSNFDYKVKLAKKYDTVVSNAPGPIYFNKHKNNIVYDAGYARQLVGNKSLFQRLMQKAYQNARALIFTNPDMAPLFDQMGIKNKTFMPLPIDVSRYTPAKKDRDSINRFTVFVPTRQNWRVKGTHNTIYAFAKASRGRNMTLIITNWKTQDIEITKALVKKLNIEDKVEYVDMVPKAELIKRIRNATVIADTFTYGTYPLVSIEALSCGKPVLCYIKEDLNKKYFGELPPILNCRTVDSISHHLVDLYENRAKIDRLGEEGRKWAVEKHSSKVIFEMYIDLFISLMNK